MRDKRKYLFLAIAILSLFSISAAAQRYVDGKDFSTKTIEAKAFKQILKLPRYGVFDQISFKVEDGTITLFGKVVEPTTKSDAKRAVARIEGVTKVVNNIEVLPLSRFDHDIRFRTLRDLSRGGGLYRYFLGANPSVRIIVENGNVALEGYVATRGDYNLMNILANGVSGVFSVTNNLIVEKELVR